MAWSISPGGDFTAAKVIGCTRNLQAGGKDTCTLVFAKNADEAHAFAEDAAVTVAGPGGTFFSGVVACPERSATGSDEEHSVRLVTKWKWLEEIPYIQLFAAGATPGTTRYKSRVILGLDTTGARQTAAQIIADILAYANSQGAGISVGTIALGETLTPPLMEMTDATCAEALRSVLRWHPDCVVYWDYAAGGTLNMEKGSSLNTISRTAGPSGTHHGTRAKVYPRGDMLLRGVQIHYEVTSTVDGIAYNNIVTDGAGASTGRRVAHLTIPLQGANITTQSQYCQTQNIPTSKTDPNFPAWIKARWPDFVATNPLAGQFELTDPEQEVHEDEEVGPGTTLSTYPRELIKGQIQPWMTGVSACPVTVKVRVRHKGSAAANPKFYKLFTRPDKILELTTEVMGTDAHTRTYSTVSGTPSEAVPTGLAAAYFQAFQSVTEEGEFENVGAEPDVDIVPGVKLSLTGAVTVSGAPVQSCSTDVFSGRTSARFGPMNASLTPSDFVEIQRAGSRSRPLVNPGGNPRITSGADSGGGTIKGATGGRLKSSSITAGVPDEDFFTCKPGATGAISIAEGAVVSAQWPGTISNSTPVPTTPMRQKTVYAADVSAGAGDKIWLKGTFVKKVYEPTPDTSVGLKLKVTVYELDTTEYEVETGTPTDTETTGHVLIAEIEEGPDGEIIIKQKHSGLISMAGTQTVNIEDDESSGGGTPSAGLQTVVRKVGSVWNVGVTSGIVQGFSARFPVLKPSNESLSGAPVRWFAEDIDASGDEGTRNVWARMALDDGDVYQGDISGVEIHLYAAGDDPTPIFTGGEEHWFLIGTALQDAGGILAPVSHITGSLQIKRMGGPNSGYSIYAA